MPSVEHSQLTEQGDFPRHGRTKEGLLLLEEHLGLDSPKRCENLLPPDLAIPCQVASQQSQTPFHQAPVSIS